MSRSLFETIFGFVGIGSGANRSRFYRHRRVFSEYFGFFSKKEDYFKKVTREIRRARRDLSGTIFGFVEIGSGANCENV